jgi:protein associated with RNAse G/E
MITVRAYKHDGSPHRSWPARVLRQDGSLLVLDAEFAEEVQHELLGTIASGTLSVEYYWLDRWYNIFRFSHPTGELRNFYCNVNVPPSFDGQVLSYVDLDIDIVVNTDFSYQLLDLEEFDQNADRYEYSPETRAAVARAVQELIKLIETRSFPFSE